MHTEKAVDRQVKTPLYQQLFTILKDAIEHGELKVGQTFYSESELQKLYHVSRATVRETTRLLENYGYIRRSQGAASIVAKEQRFLWNFYELSNDLQTDIDNLVSELRSITKQEPSEKIKRILQLSSGDFVYAIERIRKINNLKMTRSISYIASWVGVDFTQINFNERSSIYAVLDAVGQQVFTCDETLEAVIGDDVTCKLLDLPPKSALFYREKTTYNQSKRPVEFVESHYNAKYIKYYITNKLIKR